MWCTLAILSSRPLLSVHGETCWRRISIVECTPGSGRGLSLLRPQKILPAEVQDLCPNCLLSLQRLNARVPFGICYAQSILKVRASAAF